MADITARRKWQRDILENMILSPERSSDDRPVRPVEQAFVLAVIDRYAGEAGWYFRRVSSLAEESHLSLTQTKRVLEVLKRLGYVDRQPFGHGRGDLCRWRVIHQELARRSGLPLWEAVRDQVPGGRDQAPDRLDSIPAGHDQVPAARDSIPAAHDSVPMWEPQERFNSKELQRTSRTSSSSSLNASASLGEEEEGALCTKWNSVAIVEQPASAVPEWDSAIAKLRDTGLRATDHVVSEARCRRISPAILIQAVEFYAANRLAWLGKDGKPNPGVITFWVRQYHFGDDPTDLRLWPSQSAAFLRAQQQRGASDDATRAFEIIRRGRAAKKGDKQIAAELQAAGLTWPR